MEKINDIFNLDFSQEEPQQGGILVSEPFLSEIYFSRACILLTKYEKFAPTTGLVLNKKTNLTINAVFDSEIERNEEIPIFCGGPLSLDRLFYVHDIDGVRKSINIKDNDVFGGRFEDIVEYINAGLPISGHIKFFLGYSGWDRFQLDEELHNNTWAIQNNMPQSFYLNCVTDKCWEDAVVSLGKSFESWLICPEEPSLN